MSSIINIILQFPSPYILQNITSRKYYKLLLGAWEITSVMCSGLALSNQAFSIYIQSPWGMWNGWVSFQRDRRERKKILACTHMWVHKALSWACVNGSHKCMSGPEHAWACTSMAMCVHEHAIVGAFEVVDPWQVMCDEPQEYEMKWVL